MYYSRGELSVINEPVNGTLSSVWLSSQHYIHDSVLGLGLDHVVGCDWGISR